MPAPRAAVWYFGNVRGCLHIRALGQEGYKNGSSMSGGECLLSPCVRGRFLNL